MGDPLSNCSLSNPPCCCCQKISLREGKIGLKLQMFTKEKKLQNRECHRSIYNMTLSNWPRVKTTNKLKKKGTKTINKKKVERNCMKRMRFIKMF